jgi:uncharacterized FlgJ-related protein
MRVVKAYQEFVEVMDRYRRFRKIRKELEKLDIEYNNALKNYSDAVDLYLKHS